MKPESRWGNAPLSLETIALISIPSRTGHQNDGERLFLWVRPYPIWYAGLVLPLIIAAGATYTIKMPEGAPNAKAMYVLATVFLLIFLALFIFFLVARIEITINATELKFRKSVLGIGRWSRMPQSSVTKITLRTQLLTEGVFYTETGMAVKAYHRNAGLVIVADMNGISARA